MKSGTSPAWRSSFSGELSSPLPREFFLRDTRTVARDLLGCRLRSTVGGAPVEGTIVEVEAYVGPGDPASHAAERIGRTERNQAMFGPPGHAYVYRSYGIHWCLNVVTEEVGVPTAVLIRAAHPTIGLQEMTLRREGRQPLCSGPGRLAQAFGVTGDLDGHSLREEPLTLLPGPGFQDEAIGVSGRIGIRHAADWPLRFYLRGHAAVSGRPR